jgi:tetratricopeptide (TPR) repeat protein
MAPTFLKLASDRKSLAGVFGFATTAALVDLAIKQTVPGAEAAAAPTVAMAAAFSATVMSKLVDGVANLWGNHRVSKAFDEGGTTTLRHDGLNHDIEMQVGRTLATIIAAWSASQPSQTVTGELAPLIERLTAFDGPRPAWSIAAESIGIDVSESALVDIALGRAAPTPAIPSSTWSSLFVALLPGGPASVAAHASILNRLSDYVAERFPARFYVDIKQALEKHPAAWAAMQYRIDALLLTTIETQGRELARLGEEHVETRRVLLEIGEHIVGTVASLGKRIDDLPRRVTEAVTTELENHTNAMRGELTKIVDRLDTLKLRPPLGVPQSRADGGSVGRLHYSARRVPRVGRDQELSALVSFLTTHSPTPERWNRFAWWLWTGPGGIGKSRLALELILVVRSNFLGDAGFFGRESHTKFAASDWAAWRPTRATLVVFDYAAEHAEEIAKAIGAVHANDIGGRLEHSVRFLLLERDHASERLLRDLTHAAGGAAANAVESAAYVTTESHAQQGQSAPSEQQPTLLPHRELSGLTENDQLLVMRRIFEKAAKPFDEPTARTILRRTDAAGRPVLPLGNPLFAAIIAEAALEHGLVALQADTAESLVRRVIANERNQWEREGVDSQHLNLLVLATLLRRAIVDDDSITTALEDLLPMLAQRAPDQCEVLSSYAPHKSRATTTVVPLEPDRLGELLVLDRLAATAESRLKVENELAVRTAMERIVRAAWKMAPQALSQFTLNATSDLPRHRTITRLAEIVEKASTGAAADMRRMAAALCDSQVRVLMTWGSLDAADDVARRGLRLARTLAAELGTPEARRDVSVSLDNVAGIELARGRHDAALTLYQESLRLARTLAAELGTPEARRDVSISLNNVAGIELARGRHDAALTLYQESLGLARTLAAELGTPEARRDVSVSLDNVARIELARGRHDAALTLFNECVDIFRTLAAELGTPEAVVDFARSQAMVAMCRPSEAESLHALRDARSLVQAVIGEVGALPEYTTLLAEIDALVANVDRGAAGDGPADGP